MATVNPFNYLKGGFKDMFTMSQPSQITSKNVNGHSRNSSPANKCICIRPKSTIVCQVCAYLGKGRVRTTCEVHTNVIFVSDYDRCPGCGTYSFMMAELCR